MVDISFCSSWPNDVRWLFSGGRRGKKCAITLLLSAVLLGLEHFKRQKVLALSKPGGHCNILSRFLKSSDATRQNEPLLAFVN
jgi:hypothetical protein